MTFLRNVVQTLVTNVAIVVLDLSLGVLLARALGPGPRGMLALVMTLPVTLVYLADLGVSKANVYLIGRRRVPEGTAAFNSLAVGLAMGAVAVLVGWSVRDLVLGRLLPGFSEVHYGAVLLLTLPLLLYTHWMAIPRARQRFDVFNALRLLMPAVLLGSMVAALLTFGAEVRWAVVAFVVGTLVVVGVSLIVIGRMMRVRLVFDWRLLRETLAYGLKSYLQNLVSHLAYRLDIYLVAALLDTRQVAFLAIATSAAELSWYVPNAIGTVLFPRLSEESDERIHVLTAEVCRHTLAATATVALVLVLVGSAGIPWLYGPEYSPVIIPLIVLAPGVIAGGLYKVLTRYFSARNRQQMSVLAASVGLALNVALDWLFIPRLGTVGAAAASSCAYAAMGIMLLVTFRRDSGLKWSEILRPKKTDLARYVDAAQRIRVALQPGRRRDLVSEGEVRPTADEMGG